MFNNKHRIAGLFFSAIVFCQFCQGQSFRADSCGSFTLSIHENSGQVDSVRLFYTDCFERGDDTLVLVDGQAKWHGNVNRATEGILFTDIGNRIFDDARVIRFIIEPGKMTLSFSLGKDTVRDLNVTGSIAQKEKQDWEAVWHKYEADEKRVASAILYAEHHLNSYFSGYLLWHYFRRIPLDSMQLYYARLADRVKESQFGKNILSNLYTRTSDTNFKRNNSDPAFLGQLGAIRNLYDISLTDTNGQMYSLSRLKGKYVVLDFWSTWCGPCFQNIPSLRALAEEMKGMPVVFVSVAIDAGFYKWKKSLATHPFPGLNLLDGAKVAATYYKVQGIPRFIILDPEGNIAYEKAPSSRSGALKPLLLSLMHKNE